MLNSLIIINYGIQFIITIIGIELLQFKTKFSLLLVVFEV